MPSLCHYPFTPAHQVEDKAEKIGEPELHSSDEAILLQKLHLLQTISIWT